MSAGSISCQQATKVRRRRRSAGLGFTIVEVMMAATVMALAITTSITTMQRAFVSLDSARNLTIAGQVMQGEIEKMRLKDWATVDAYPAGPTNLTVDGVFTGNSAIGNRFTMTRTVTTPQTDMKEITLTVSWRSYDGRVISRSYTTCYCRYGMYDYFFNNTG
jgi:Tfp pilus assembly protein PilV